MGLAESNILLAGKAVARTMVSVFIRSAEYSSSHHVVSKMEALVADELDVDVVISNLSNLGMTDFKT